MDSVEPEFGSNADYTDNIRFFYMVRDAIFQEYIDWDGRTPAGTFVWYSHRVAIRASWIGMTPREVMVEHGNVPISEEETPELMAYLELAEYIYNELGSIV